MYRRNANVLCLKLCEKKKSVTMMTTIHHAVYVEVNRRNRENDKVKKPLAVYDYTQKMSGVDRNDQFMTYYNSQRRSVKWTSKLAIHLFSLCVTNAYILYKMYGDKNPQLDHGEFILKVVDHLIEEGMKTRVLKIPHVPHGKRLPNLEDGDHFPEQIPRKEGSKRKASRPCFACNGSWDNIRNKKIPKRCSGIWCKICKKVLCVTPCFDIFHTKANYKEILLNMRYLVEGGNDNE